MQNHNQTLIFIFFHLISKGVSIGCKQLVGHNTPRFLRSQLVFKRSVFCSFVTKSNQALIKYSPKQFLSYHHTWRVPQIFTSTPSLHSNSASLHFTLEALPSVASPIFSSLEPPPPPFKGQIRFQQVLKISVHAIFPLQTKLPFLEIAQFFFNTGTHIPLNAHAVSIDPDSLLRQS